MKSRNENLRKLPQKLQELRAEKKSASPKFRTISIEEAKELLQCKKCSLVENETACPKDIQNGSIYVWKKNEQWYYKTAFIDQIILSGTFDHTLDQDVIHELNSHSVGDIELSHLMLMRMSRPYLKLNPEQQAEVIFNLSTDWPLTEEFSEDEQCRGCLAILERKILSTNEENTNDSIDELGRETLVANVNAFRPYLFPSVLDRAIRKNFEQDATIADIIRFIDYLLYKSARELGYKEPITLQTPPKDSYVKCGQNEYQHINGSSQLLYHGLNEQESSLFQLVLNYESNRIHDLAEESLFQLKDALQSIMDPITYPTFLDASNDILAGIQSARGLRSQEEAKKALEHECLAIIAQINKELTIRSILSLLDQLSTCQDADQRAGFLAELKTLIASSLNSLTQLIQTIYALPERHRAEFLKTVGIYDQSLMQYDLVNVITLVEISAMIPFLNNADELVVNPALSLLIIASQNWLNRRGIREAGGIAPLLRLLTSGNMKVKHLVLLVLSNLVLDNIDNQNAIREAGGITSLIGLLASDDNETQKYASFVLGNLAGNNIDNQNAIREAGGMTVLFRLVTSDDSETKQFTLLALSALGANNIDNQNAIRDAGGMTSLMVLQLKDALQSIMAPIKYSAFLNAFNDRRAGIQSACGLRSALEQECLAIMAKINQELTTRSILTLLQKSSLCRELYQRNEFLAELKKLITSSQNSYTQLVHTIYALPEKHRAQFLLAVDLSNQKVTQYDPAYVITPVEMSAMIPLFKNTDVDVVGRALTILTKASQQNRNTFREAGGIAPLIGLLTSGNIIKQYYAILGLFVLANNVDNQNAIREAGGIVPLVRVLASDDNETQSYAAEVLSFLAFNNVDNQNAIREAGGIVPLVGLLASDDTKTQESAALALGYLAAGNVDNQNAIREAGGIPLLVKLLTSNDTKTQESAALALRNLAAGNVDNQNAIREAGGIPLLVKLLTSNDGKTQKSAALALGYLAAGNVDNQNAIREAGGIPLLVKLLTSNDGKTQKSAALALSNLAFNNVNNRNVIREAGGLSLLIGLLTSGDSETRKCAALALNNLAVKNVDNQNAIREAGGIDLLVELLASDDNETRQFAALAFNNLGDNNVDNQNAIREAGGLVPLVGLLTSGDSETRKYAALALNNLSVFNIDNKNAIREAGGIPLWVGLLTSGEGEARKYTAIALNNLANANADNQNAIREAGGIVPLVGLLTSGDSETREHAASALNYLSANNVDNQNAIYEAGGIPLLVGLLTSGDSKTIKYTVLTLNHSINARSLLYYAQNLTDTQIDAILALSEVPVTNQNAVLVSQESIVIEKRIEKKLQQKKYPEQFKNTCKKMILLVKTLHSNNIDQKQMLQEIENLIDSPQNYKQYHALTEQYMKVVDENFLALMILSAALAAKIVSVNYSDNASIKYTSKKPEPTEAAVEQVNTPTRCT